MHLNVNSGMMDQTLFVLNQEKLLSMTGIMLQIRYCVKMELKYWKWQVQNFQEDVGAHAV